MIVLSSSEYGKKYDFFVSLGGKYSPNPQGALNMPLLVLAEIFEF